MASPRRRSSTSTVARILANSSAAPVAATSTSARSIGPRSPSAERSRWPTTSRPTRTATEIGSGSPPASAPAPGSTRRRQSSPPSGDAPAMTRRMWSWITTRRPRSAARTVAIPAGPASSSTCSASRCWTASDRLSSAFVSASSRPRFDLVLEPPGVVDGDRRMGGERGEQVGIVGAEPVPALRRMEVQGADRLAAEDQRRADDRPEGVAGRARALDARMSRSRRPRSFAARRIACVDRPSPKAISKSSRSDRVPRHRDDPESVALAVPQQHVAAVGAEQTSGRRRRSPSGRSRGRATR